MPNASQPLVFIIRGMDCVDEVVILKRALSELVGGEDRLAFDILNGRMTVRSGIVTAAEVIAAVRRTGMDAVVQQEERSVQDNSQEHSRTRTRLTIASGGLIVIAIAAQAAATGSLSQILGLDGHKEFELPIAVKILFALSAAAGVWIVLPKAWHALRSLRPDMNLLMTIAVGGAMAIDEWFEAATVAFLFAVSLQLESWSVSRARRAVAALMELSPPTARLKETGQEVPAEQVTVGSIIVVKPGERLPLDGAVSTGQSHVNQAPITGESAPVSKQRGDEVFAGTINGDGLLEIKTTKAAQDSTLAHIIRMVGDAQGKRAPSEQWVEKFARWYTPAVLIGAVAILVVQPLLGVDWRHALYNSLVLLVIACPCALVISTPVSIVAALAAAARRGVLVKGGAFIETVGGINAFAFDKTGTLTHGRPVVVGVVALGKHSEEELLERAAAMERLSDHPLAQSIVRYAADRGIDPRAATDFRILQGKGAAATFDGRPFWLGSHRYLEERRQETPEVHEQLEELSAAGRTVVVVGNDEHVCGYVLLADETRSTAKEVVERLRRAGVAHLVMLTGDNEPTARAVAAAAGIQEFKAELLPADKVRAIEALLQTYGSVAMVGDGVNDAPALGRATIGIAMGAAGSDAALEIADIALMSDDITQIPWLVAHSRRTSAVIRQNIYFSLAVKAAFVVLTFAGLSSLWAAIAADSGASLIVVFNGLRLLKTR